jgi:transcriptional regulator with XRE-family HTH domain
MRRRNRAAQRVDAYVGERLRVCRTLAGLSQTQLGKGIGITFQQVQKYERGANRISAGALYALGRLLGVPVLLLRRSGCTARERCRGRPAHAPGDNRIGARLLLYSGVCAPRPAAASQIGRGG